jgi:hypothetical protein
MVLHADVNMRHFSKVRKIKKATNSLPNELAKIATRKHSRICALLTWIQRPTKFYKTIQMLRQLRLHFLPHKNIHRKTHKKTWLA